MNPDERIDRMEEAGLISGQQAALLRESLGSAPAQEPEDAAQPQPVASSRFHWTYALAACAAAGAFIFLGSGSGEEIVMVQNVEQSLNDPGAAAPGSGKLISILLLVAVVPLLAWGWLHNSLVNAEERVFAAWAQVESTYQRRADLVPALLETVTTFMQHEKQTLSEVVLARGQDRRTMQEVVDALLQSQLDSSRQLQSLGGRPPEDDAALEAMAASQQKVGALMNDVMAVSENYPELRSADQFLELQAQLEGTENRINVARMRFNAAAGEFNAAIRRMPANLVASTGGFRRKAYFQADKSARQRPELNFD